MRRCSVLTPSQFHPNSRTIYGFDIETADKNKEFVCASIYHSQDKNWTFWNKRELIDFFQTKRFKNSVVAATNLGFDFFGTFFDQPEEMDFNILFRGSDLIFAKTNIDKGRFTKTASRRGQSSLTFLDTMNFAKMSVLNLGKMLGCAKMEEPEFFGKQPKDQVEREYMARYNMRDAEISQKAMSFLMDSFSHLGASPRNTIASTAMSLFKNRYLDKAYFLQPDDVLEDEFEGYYGGRTEAFCRGKIEDYNYYDINSLYPSVMRNEYPDPNTWRRYFRSTLKYIKAYEGVSKVSVSAPDIQYPFLPYRHKDKLLFPTGTFTGWYSHIELRKAIQLGYDITEIHQGIYFRSTCEPFKQYVDDLYKLRLEFKADNNPMEKAVKLLMSSLYGKFGQRLKNYTEWQPFTQSREELDKLYNFNVFGNYISYKKVNMPYAPFCIPIWALYTTAYGRLKLYDHITLSNPVYCDTDSIMTKDELPTSTRLGEFKLEMKIKKGIIVKPKFYMLKKAGRMKPGEKKNLVRAKGIGFKLKMDDFFKILTNKEVDYDKFARFKEALRNGRIPNEIFEMHKDINLEDDKRIWPAAFNHQSFQSSSPVKMVGGELPADILKRERKEEARYRRLMQTHTARQRKAMTHGSDFYDSMGNDISKEEFFENETSFT